MPLVGFVLGTTVSPQCMRFPNVSEKLSRERKFDVL